MKTKFQILVNTDQISFYDHHIFGDEIPMARNQEFPPYDRNVHEYHISDPVNSHIPRGSAQPVSSLKNDLHVNGAPSQTDKHHMQIRSL